MNLKLNNEVRRESKMSEVIMKPKKTLSSVKEERRRTGRYIAILVGILLFLLAIYHAWVRKIPVIASLVVPALIMFIYVGWVLYTASRDKKRALALDAEAALQEMSMALEHENQEEGYITQCPHNNNEVSPTSTPTLINKEFGQIIMVKPVILVNGEPPDDLEQDLTAVTVVSAAAKPWQQKEFVRRKFKRKFCRSKRNDIFKRSYSIA